MSEQALSVQNAQKISQLATAVEKLAEVRRTSKALEAKKVQKRKETREGIEQIEDKVKQIAVNNGIEINLGEKDTEKSMMAKLSPAQQRRMRFFTSKEQRGSRYADGWR